MVRAKKFQILVFHCDIGPKVKFSDFFKKIPTIFASFANFRAVCACAIYRRSPKCALSSSLVVVVCCCLLGPKKTKPASPVKIQKSKKRKQKMRQHTRVYTSFYICFAFFYYFSYFFQIFPFFFSRSNDEVQKKIAKKFFIFINSL